MKIKSLLMLLAFLGLPLASCTSTSSTQPSPQGTDTTQPGNTDTTQPQPSDEPYVDYYVSAVSDTSAPMIAGTYEGKELDYVISSYPVIFAARNQSKKELTEIINVAEEFGEKYDTDGFPQAGLFIKTSLDEDASKSSDIESFLAAFDSSVTDLVNGATKAVEYMNAYNQDATLQQSRFGFNSNVLKGSQNGNKLAFIEADKNPTIADFNTFKTSLNIDVAEEDLSKYYPTSSQENASAEAESLEFNVVCPKGAPAASLARYATSDKLILGQPTQVQAAFKQGTADFIVFDSVNGLKLSAQNGDNYKLVRMVTYGNLYVVATGNDDNSKLDREDLVLSYGQNFVPDLAFKAVYGD